VKENAKHRLSKAEFFPASQSGAVPDNCHSNAPPSIG
jgi:hypothetical protein